MEFLKPLGSALAIFAFCTFFGIVLVKISTRTWRCAKNFFAKKTKASQPGNFGGYDGNRPAKTQVTIVDQPRVGEDGKISMNFEVISCGSKKAVSVSSLINIFSTIRFAIEQSAGGQEMSVTHLELYRFSNFMLNALHDAEFGDIDAEIAEK